MTDIKEKISYVIPISFTDDHRGLPVLVYETMRWENKADLAFGIFFIGLRARKPYATSIQISSLEGEILIPFDSEEFGNRNVFQVDKAPDGEKIVSASLKVNFENVPINKPGIHRIDARLLDVDTEVLLDQNFSLFDIKPRGVVRDEFR